MKIIGIMPVYEDADWLEWAVKGIIDFVDLLVISEGHMGPPYHFWGNRSRDDTLIVLRKLQAYYKDKIVVINNCSTWLRHWHSGEARTYNKVLKLLKNKGLLLEGNWLFTVDSDEFYTNRQLCTIRNTLESTHKDFYNVHSRMFVYNFKYFFPTTHGRLIRITDGMFFKPGHVPCYPDGSMYISLGAGYLLEDEPMFHYSFVRPNERMLKRIKMEFLARMYKPEVFNWFNKVYMKWSEENAEEIYRLNEEITGNTGFLFAGRSSKLQEYTGIHPEFLDDHPYRRINDLRESQNNCQAKITFSLFFLRLFQDFGASIKALLRKVPGLRNKN